VIPPGPIYEYEDVGKGKLAEYALGRDTRLVVFEQGHVTQYRLVSLIDGTCLVLTADTTERLRETLEALRAPIPENQPSPTP
jgi:hypothetical protein